MLFFLQLSSSLCITILINNYNNNKYNFLYFFMLLLWIVLSVKFVNMLKVNNSIEPFLYPMLPLGVPHAGACWRFSIYCSLLPYTSYTQRAVTDNLGDSIQPHGQFAGALFSSQQHNILYTQCIVSLRAYPR